MSIVSHANLGMLTLWWDRVLLRLEFSKRKTQLSIEDRLKLHEKRRRLQSRIDSFIAEGESILPEETQPRGNRRRVGMFGRGDDDDGSDSEVEEADESDDGSVNSFADPDANAAYPERQQLPLPSSMHVSADSSTPLQNLAEQQLELEKGQANDALHKLRIAIGHTSFIYRHRIQKARGYDARTRAHDEVRAANKTIDQYAETYRACREAMQALGADDETLGKYQELKDEHLKADTVTMNPNEPGQRNYKLAWIWGLAAPDGSETPAYNMECEHFILSHPNLCLICLSVSC